jgi:hypothetical protein
VCVVTCFGVSKAFGETTDWSPRTIFLLLRKNGAPGKLRGVGLEEEGFLVVWMSQKDVAKEDVFEFLKGSLLVVGP